MISFTNQQTIYGDLSQNTTTANLARGAYLMNQEHRYLLQKYFSNEMTYSIPTQGGGLPEKLTLTGGLSLGATTGTLTSVWTGLTSNIQTTFSDGESYLVTYTNGSASISWSTPLTSAVSSTIQIVWTITTTLSVGAVSAILTTAWTGNTTKIQVTFSDKEIRMVYFTNGSTSINWDVPLTGAPTSAITLGGQQFYPLPPNYSKLKTITITIGVLQWTLGEIFSTAEWTQLNVFPYYADIPKNFFIYPGGDHGAQIGIWPIPATTGNIITFSYKYRVPDLSLADYTTPGTLSITNGTNTVTGAGSSFVPTTNVQNESRWIQFAPTPGTSTTSGDNMWYQISQIPSSTSILLYQPYQGTTVTSSPAGSYTIGQMPLLMEDFHDMLYLKALMTYWSTIKSDKEKYENFKEEYNRKLLLLADYSGKNTVNVNLRSSINQRNPNLFSSNIGGTP